MEALGDSCRLSEIHAVIGLAQLEKIDAFRERRQALAERYDAGFHDRPELHPAPAHPPRGTAWSSYLGLIDLDRLYHGD